MTVLRTIVALLAICITAPAAAQPRFEVAGDELRILDPETGALNHVLLHGSVWDAKPDPDDPPEKPSFPIVGPIELDEAVYYATRGTVFRMDPSRGVIERRLTFPARVVELATDDDQLVVTVEREIDDWENEGVDEEPERVQVELVHRPGTAPPHEMWRTLHWIDAWKDPLNLAPPVAGDPDDFTQAEHRAALERLEAIGPQEPDNPFYPFFIGQQHLALDQEREAEAAFDRARDVTGAPWFVDVQIAAAFDHIGRLDHGDVAFDRGMRKLGEVQPSFRRSWFMVGHAMLLGIWSRDATEAAIRASEFEAVDRIQERTHRLLPNLEGSSLAWAALARWYESNGQDELAEKWRERSRADGPFEHMADKSRSFDLTLTLLLGAVFGSLFMAFLLGLRSRRPEQVRGFRPRKRDLAGLALGLVASFGLFWFMNTILIEIDESVAIPDEAMIGSWGSPNVERWIDGLEPSSARSELADLARETREAQTRGTERPESPDEWPTLVFDAIGTHAHKVALRGLFTGEAPTYERWDVAPLVGAWFVGLLFALVLGAVTSCWAPPLARSVAFVIPGGPPSAGPLSVLVSAFLVAAFAAIVLGTDSLLTRLAVPDFYKYFGMSTFDRPGPPSFSKTWAWLCIAAAGVIHVAAAAVDWRRLKRDKPAIAETPVPSDAGPHKIPWKPIGIGAVWLIALVSLSGLTVATFNERALVRDETSRIERDLKTARYELEDVQKNSERIVEQVRKQRMQLKTCQQRLKRIGDSSALDSGSNGSK